MHHIIIDLSQRRSVPMRPRPVRARVRRRRRRATTRRRDERNSSPPTPIRARRRLHPPVHRAQQSFTRLLVPLSRHDVRSLVHSRPRPRARPRGCSRTRGLNHRDRDASRASRSTPARRDDDKNARTRRTVASSRFARRRARRTRVESPQRRRQSSRVLLSARLFCLVKRSVTRYVVCMLCTQCIP